MNLEPSHNRVPANRPLQAGEGECWKTIGVLGGDQTCPQLEQFIHCRNCPVHAEAGAKLLDRALPAGYREEWTRRLAEQKAGVAAGRKSAVIFRLGEDWLALPTQVLQHAVERRPIRPLPHQRGDFILGLAAVRGELLICFSLQRLIGLAEYSAPPGRAAERLLVTGWQGTRQAFPADEVFGLHRYLVPEIKPTLSFIPAANFLQGMLDWEGRSVGLINEGLLFTTFNEHFT